MDIGRVNLLIDSLLATKRVEIEDHHQTNVYTGLLKIAALEDFAKNLKNAMNLEHECEVRGTPGE